MYSDVKIENLKMHRYARFNFMVVPNPYQIGTSG